MSDEHVHSQIVKACSSNIILRQELNLGYKDGKTTILLQRDLNVYFRPMEKGLQIPRFHRVDFCKGGCLTILLDKLKIVKYPP